MMHNVVLIIIMRAAKKKSFSEWANLIWSANLLGYECHMVDWIDFDKLYLHGARNNFSPDKLLVVCQLTGEIPTFLFAQPPHKLCKNYHKLLSKEKKPIAFKENNILVCTVNDYQKSLYAKSETCLDITCLTNENALLFGGKNPIAIPSSNTQLYEKTGQLMDMSLLNHQNHKILLIILEKNDNSQCKRLKKYFECWKEHLFSKVIFVPDGQNNNDIPQKSFIEDYNAIMIIDCGALRRQPVHALLKCHCLHSPTHKFLLTDNMDESNLPCCAMKGTFQLKSNQQILGIILTKNDYENCIAKMHIKNLWEMLDIKHITHDFADQDDFVYHIGLTNSKNSNKEENLFSASEKVFEHNKALPYEYQSLHPHYYGTITCSYPHHNTILCVGGIIICVVLLSLLVICGVANI